MIYFHRRTGVAFECAPEYLDRLKTRLRESVGVKFVEGEWDILSSHGGALRIRAIEKGHLDVTSVTDYTILAG